MFFKCLIFLCYVLFVCVVVFLFVVCGGDDDLMCDFMQLIFVKVQVVGYCGVSVLCFEYMLVLYCKVIEDGVDVIEFDFVLICDGVLVVCYENEILGMMNVLMLLQYVSCKVIKMIDGVQLIGWFIEDFMFVELKMLWVCEWILQVCFVNIVYNDQFEILMFDEIVVFVKQMFVQIGCMIYLYLEIKYLIYFQLIGLLFEDCFVDVLLKDVYMLCMVIVYIQLFEVVNLKVICNWIKLSQLNWKFVQLMDEVQQCLYDFVKVNDMCIYGDLLMCDGMCEIVIYVNGVGLYKMLIIVVVVDGMLQQLMLYVCYVYEVGFVVYLYMFCLENNFLFVLLKDGGMLFMCNMVGLVCEIQVYLCVGIDGFFIDDLVVGCMVVDMFMC